jgi:hypothetical protein
MKSNDLGPLVRVELEYKNGTITRLTGKNAQKWLEMVNGQVTIAAVHGFGLPPFKWKNVKKRANHKELLTECLGALAWLEEGGDVVADVPREDFYKRCVQPLLSKIMDAL